jgi:hypothetical protein
MSSRLHSRRGRRTRGYAPFRPGSGLPDIFRTGLIADYQFLEGSGTTVADNSGNGFTATLGTSISSLPTWIATGGAT